MRGSTPPQSRCSWSSRKTVRKKRVPKLNCIVKTDIFLKCDAKGRAARRCATDHQSDHDDEDEVDHNDQVVRPGEALEGHGDDAVKSATGNANGDPGCGMTARKLFFLLLLLLLVLSDVIYGNHTCVVTALWTDFFLLSSSRLVAYVCALERTVKEIEVNIYCTT